LAFFVIERIIEILQHLAKDLRPFRSECMLALAEELPLVVDLNGTLLKTDSLHETCLELLRVSPLAVLALPALLLKGRAAVERYIAPRVSIDVENWPVREDLLKLLREAAASGRQVVLATAADSAIAEAIAVRFPFFSKVIASDGRVNCKGKEKARRLAQEFPGGFIYVGNSNADLDIWKNASGAILVDAPRSVARSAREIMPAIAEFESKRLGFGVLRRTLRLHQWAKNALVFVPLVLGGKGTELSAWISAYFGFVALGLTASASYIFNDLWDLPNDRKHWCKRWRPIASGTISIPLASLLSLLSLVIGVALAFYLGPPTVAMLAAYLALTMLYSLQLKRIPILDVCVLAGLFTMRLGIGIAISGVRVSPWLLVFSMFVFLSLSLAKRHTEVLQAVERDQDKLHGRGYGHDDKPLTLGLGIASMQGAVLIFVLYLIEDAFPHGLYKTPEVLWVAPVLLFLFLSRIWLFCQRGWLNDDPVAFALKDKTSILLGGLMALIFVAAMLRLPL
jgi:4-hydroxybenzoate polyprenyltransferase/phosphoserine phosphatase